MPALQSVHEEIEAPPVEFRNVPAGQADVFVEDCGQYAPVGQRSGEDKPGVGHREPEGHGVQKGSPIPLYDPAGQAAQNDTDVAPIEAEKVPPTQGVHDELN